MNALKTRIHTRHYQDSVAFYTDVLGMTILDAWNSEDDQGTILGIAKDHQGEAFLELAPGNPNTDYSALSLQFRVADIQATVRQLGDKWPFTDPEARPWGSVYVTLRDPSGVQIILYQGDL